MGTWLWHGKLSSYLPSLACRMKALVYTLSTPVTQLLVHKHGKAAGDGPGSWASSAPMSDEVGEPGSSLQPDADLDILAIWGNKPTEAHLSFSLCLSKK